MDADEQRYATHGRDAGDNCRWARARWGTGGYSASAHRADGPGRYGADYGRRPPQKQPLGSGGDLPKHVHFVPAADSAAVPSGNHGDYRNPSSTSSWDPARQPTSSPPAPGSLASNTVVAKMMKCMNYKEGTGLGRHGQGIVAPVEVIPRPKNAGLGTAEGSITGWAHDEPPPSAENWPKWDEAGGAKKQNRDLVFDVKILATPSEESAAEAVAWVHKALARESQWSSGGQGEKTAAAISKAIARVQEASASGTLTTGELIREFTALREQCPSEYTTYSLADAARAIAAPLLRRSVFRHWEPLDDPSRGQKAVAELKGTLLDDGSVASPYAALVDDVVVGPMLASAAKMWDARKPEPMVQFLETWGDALPLPAIQRVLEQVVMPKLSAAVESWEPRWEPVPCHVWVHPWIPHLGRWLKPLYVTVRGKLGRALQGWHAARVSADRDMVLPWKDAFGPAAWGEFVSRHVVPYLRRGLRAVRVRSPEQDGDGFRGVMRWAPSVVSASDMARLLEEEFFGKWQDSLCRWLQQAARPTVAEAMAWHAGWKRLLTPELLANERVRVPIKAGLEMIRRGPAAVGRGCNRRQR